MKHLLLTLYLREYCGEALNAYPLISTVKEGHLPERENEIALPENALQYLEFDGKVGDTISIPFEVSLRNDRSAAYEYTADFTLCGILENSYLGYSSGIVEGVVGEGTAGALLPERYLLYSTDFKTKSTEQFQSIVNEFQEERLLTKQIYSTTVFCWKRLVLLTKKQEQQMPKVQDFPL